MTNESNANEPTESARVQAIVIRLLSGFSGKTERMRIGATVL
jgi:hypothetical protein